METCYYFCKQSHWVLRKPQRTGGRRHTMARKATRKLSKKNLGSVKTLGWGRNHNEVLLRA